MQNNQCYTILIYPNYPNLFLQKMWSTSLAILDKKRYTQKKVKVTSQSHRSHLLPFAFPTQIKLSYQFLNSLLTISRNRMVELDLFWARFPIRSLLHISFIFSKKAELSLQKRKKFVIYIVPRHLSSIIRFQDDHSLINTETSHLEFLK